MFILILQQNGEIFGEHFTTEFFQLSSPKRFSKVKVNIKSCVKALVLLIFSRRICKYLRAINMWAARSSLQRMWLVVSQC